MRILSYSSDMLAQLTDLIFPPHAPFSDRLASDGPQGSDWQNVRFYDEPCCAQCGFPFEYTAGPDTICGDCAAHPPTYDRARAAFVYDDASRRAVLAFKHGGRTDALPIFAAHMQRAARRFLPETDLLLPVPLHPKRLIKRRYNQAALLARALSRRVNIPYATDILLRIKNTQSQGAQTAKGRQRNVSGAFAVPDHRRDLIRDKRLLLIDDVMTTGATINACARTLKRAGAAHIDVVTLARTVKDHQQDTAHAPH